MALITADTLTTLLKTIMTFRFHLYSRLLGFACEFSRAFDIQEFWKNTRRIEATIEYFI